MEMVEQLEEHKEGWMEAWTKALFSKLSSHVYNSTVTNCIPLFYRS